MTIYTDQKYCVYHTIYHGDKMPPNYIGSTSIDKINNGYHGSVKSKKYKQIWEYEISHNDHLFTTIIISTHYTKREALWKELQVQKIFNVTKNPLFINMGHAQPNGFFGMDVSGKNNPNFSNKWDESQKYIASNRMKKIMSDKSSDFYIKSSNVLIELNAKYYKLVSPDGEIFIIKNLSKFCRDTKNKYNLCMQNLSKLSNNKIKYYKGWYCYHCDENGMQS